MTAFKDDWRLYRGQEDYLKHETLHHRRYTKDDHDHCEFCWISINKPLPDAPESENYVTEGYCTGDERIWICKKCFEDFTDYFIWKVIEEQP